MKIQSQNLVFIIFAFTIPLVFAETLCPDDPQTIYPCECSLYSGETNLECLGTNVNQESFERLFRVLREVNNIPPNGWLSVNKFMLTFSNLTTVDLTPFMRVSFELLTFPSIVSLRKFTGPPVDTHEGLIQATNFSIDYTSVTTEGLGETLRYFHPRMKKLTISDSYLTSASIDPNATAEVETEFLPGLGNLVNLETINFYLNRIKRIGHGAFMKNSRLSLLHLGQNRINEIAENAFVFAENHDDLKNVTLTLNIAQNDLNDTGIPEYHGLHSILRPVSLDLYGNKLTTIAAEKFQEFLESPFENQLWLMYNSLICDSRVKWLKDGVNIFGTRVFQANCANDPGKTVFTSDLIG